MTEANTSSTRARLSNFVNGVCDLVEGVIPPEEVRQHFRNSRVEFWRGVRAMIDAHIDHIGSKSAPQKGAAVTVE